MNGLGAEKVSFPKDGRKILKLVEIAVGDDNSWALDIHGRVWSWGRDDFAQLGHIDPDVLPATAADPKGKGKAREENNPAPAKSPGTKSDLETALPRLCLATAGIQDIARIAAGRDFAAAQTQNGELYTWGRVDGMALGHDTTQLAVKDLRFIGDWNRPVESVMSVKDTYNHLPYTLICAKQVENIGTLPGLPAPTVIPTHAAPALAVGPGHIAVANDMGAVYCWGAGEGWRLGLGHWPKNMTGISARSGCSDEMQPKQLPPGAFLGVVAGARFGMLLGAPGALQPLQEGEREPTPEVVPWSEYPRKEANKSEHAEADE